MSDTGREIQRILKLRGYDLGKSGPAGDGIDGDPGERTLAAALAELRKTGALPTSASTLAPHKRLKPETILAAQASERKHGVPTAIALAQFALESQWGAKDLGAHNYGGIKVRKSDFGPDGKPKVPYVLLPTREVINGKSVIINDYFRAFKSQDEYFDFHGELLANGAYMKQAMAQLPSLGKFADELGGGGMPGRGPRYATAPDYGKSIRELLRYSDLMKYNLGEYEI